MVSQPIYKFSMATCTPKRISCIIAVLLFLAGGLLLYSAVKEYYFAKDTVNWKTTEGRIVDIKITHLLPSSEAGDGGYEVMYTYQYTVSGVEYPGKATQLFTWENEANKFVKDNLKDKPVLVYYNPNNPQENLIKFGGVWGEIGFKVLFSLGFIICGLILMTKILRTDDIKF